MNSSTCRWRLVSGPPVGPGAGVGAGRAAMEETVTRSRVRGKHPFVFSLDLERLFVQGECLTRMVRCRGQVPRSVPGDSTRRFDLTVERSRGSRLSQHCKLLP